MCVYGGGGGGYSIDETDRVYALKGRSRTSFVTLLSMIVVQFVYGIVCIALFRRKGEVAFNSPSES